MKRVTEDVEIISIKIGDYEFPPPPGLSELLNRAGAWVYVPPEEGAESQKQYDETMKDYDIKHVMENGKLRTYFTYKGKNKLK